VLRVSTSREPDQFSLVAVSSPKHLLQCERSVDYGPDMHHCLMLAFGITDAQHLGAANQYAPPPEIMSRVVNDRIFHTAMLHEFPTGIKRRLFRRKARIPLLSDERNAVQGTPLDIEEH
jgi:hypothetical protein